MRGISVVSAQKNGRTASKGCRFVIIRHGETVWNVEQRIIGHADSPLTSNGEREARRLASDFSQHRFDAVFSSDVSRAQNTAEILVKSRGLTVSTTSLLRERYFGRYEGKKITTYMEELQKELAIKEDLDEEKRFSYKIAQDIESDEEMMHRFMTFIHATARMHQGKTLLVVSHGGIMRTFLEHIHFGTRKELAPGSVKNLGYATLHVSGKDIYVGETQGIEKFLEK